MRRPLPLAVRSDKGFSLIEVMLVVAVIGILAINVTMQVDYVLKKARDSRRKFEIKGLQTALEAYHSEHGEYPFDVSCCDTSAGQANSVHPCAPPWNGSRWILGGLQVLEAKGYYRSLPVDPRNSQTSFYYYESTSPGQYEYGVRCGTTFCSYMLSTSLELPNDADADPGCNECYMPHNYCVTGGGARPHAPC